MKTYDLYGAMPRTSADAADRGAARATAIALRVQSALDIDLYARDERTFLEYRCSDFGTENFGEVFVSANFSQGDSALYPNFDHAVVVGVNEPLDVTATQQALESIDLTLVLRRRREYAVPEPSPTSPTVDLYGASTDSARVVAALSPALGMSFDGNEMAATGKDSHYYDESARYGTLLVFDNMATAFDDQPFPQYADTAAVVIAINAAERGSLRRILTSHGLVPLRLAGDGVWR